MRGINAKTILISILIFLVILLLVIRLFTPKKSIIKISPPAPTPTPFEYKTMPFNAAGNPEQVDPEIYFSKKWIKQLPISTKDYYLDLKIEYMATDSAILALLYPKDKGDEKQISSLKTEITSKLKEIGVDLNKEKIIWQIK